MKINKQELHSIFTGIINNDETKFKELYEKYYSLVEAIAFSILKNKEISQDIAQEVFTKIFELPENQLPKNNEASWLYTVTKNEAIAYIRKQKNTVNIEDIYNVEQEDEYINDVISKDSYNKIIKKLEAKEQEIVSLKVIGDLSFKEIGNMLNMPIGTVQWKYYKAMHLLRVIFSNLIMFIITISLYITRKTKKNRNKQVDKVITNTTNTEENKSSETERVDELDKKEESIEQDSSSSLKNEIDKIFPNDKLETNTITNTVEINKKANNQIDIINILLIGIAGITLAITIILLIIFSKHQQNRNKKTSK